MALPIRSPAQWGVRLLLAAVAAMLAYGSIARTLGSSWRTPAVALAYGLAPDDARIAGAWATRLSDVTASAAQRARADVIARAALLRDPTTVAAVAALGLNAQIRGDTATARRSFTYAMRLSRRHLQTQLWAIEDAVARGDVAMALEQYDIALRTSRDGGELLFPVLTGAIDDADVRTKLVAMLARGVPWGNDFMIHAAAASQNPSAVAQLLTSARRAGVAVPESAQSRTVDTLLATGQPQKAWAYYATIRSDVDRRMSRNPKFAEEYGSPTQFDWVPVDNEQLASSIEGGAGGGRFDFALSGLAGGPVLRQVQLLPPGTYFLNSAAGSVEGASAAGAYWLLSCQNGRELGRVDVVDGNRVKAQLRVPADCPVQVLALIARPSDQAGSTTGQIVEARLYPVTPT